MTALERPSASCTGDLQRVRLAGGVLLADGLLRIGGRGASVPRLPGPGNRWLGGLEVALGLVLLDRAPLDPVALYRVGAPAYDKLSPLWRGRLYRGALDAFDAGVRAALPAGGDVLDLGCGTGAVLERLTALGIRFGTYTGVDASSAMLARARAKVGHLPGTNFKRLDLRTDALPEGPFDLIVSAWALEHLEDPAAVVASARARLRPEGRIVLFFECETRSPRGTTLRRLWRFFGAPLVSSSQTRSWPGLVLLQRFRTVGPDVAVATLTAAPPAVASSGRAGP